MNRVDPLALLLGRERDVGLDVGTEGLYPNAPFGVVFGSLNVRTGVDRKEPGVAICVTPCTLRAHEKARRRSLSKMLGVADDAASGG